MKLQRRSAPAKRVTRQCAAACATYFMWDHQGLWSSAVRQCVLRSPWCRQLLGARVLDVVLYIFARGCMCVESRSCHHLLWRVGTGSRNATGIPPALPHIYHSALRLSKPMFVFDVLTTKLSTSCCSPSSPGLPCPLLPPQQRSLLVLW